MRNMLYIIWGSLCLLLVISGCKSTDGGESPRVIDLEDGSCGSTARLL